jgi:hypothetical protein
MTMVVWSFGVTFVFKVILVSVVLHEEQGSKEGVNHKGLGNGSYNHSKNPRPDTLKSTNSDEPHVKGVFLAFHTNLGVVETDSNL